jgi:hypothetical protein
MESYHLHFRPPRQRILNYHRTFDGFAAGYLDEAGFPSNTKDLLTVERRRRFGK